MYGSRQYRSFSALSLTILLLLPTAGCVPPDLVLPTLSGGEPEGPPRIVRFDVEPPDPLPGRSVTLSWEVADAVSAQISGLEATPVAVPLQGSRVVVAEGAMTYTLTAGDASGRTASVTRELLTRHPLAGTFSMPAVIYFRSNPPTVMQGQTATLEWRTANAASVEITGLGRVEPAGQRVVNPDERQHYTLTARDAAGRVASDDLQILVAYPQVIAPRPELVRPLPERRPEIVAPQPEHRPGIARLRPMAPALLAGLAAPAPRAPADGSVFSHFPRRTMLRWTEVPGAASYTVEVEFCPPSGCARDTARHELRAGLRGTDYTFDFVGAQPGRWRVWAVDANGMAGAKSPWWEFRYQR